MHSLRAVEDLSPNQIKDYLIEKYNINNTIINNASLETYKIKQRYGERLLAFFNIILAAALISNFILYDNNGTVVWLFNSRLNTFFCIADIFCLILATYTVAVCKRFYTQYTRQKAYRDINNEIVIILNDIDTFFRLSDFSSATHISIETLNSFLEIIYLSVMTRIKYRNYKIKLFKEWKGIIIVSIFILIGIVLSTLFFIISFN